MARALQPFLSSSDVRKAAESWKKLCWAPFPGGEEAMPRSEVDVPRALSPGGPGASV